MLKHNFWSTGWYSHPFSGDMWLLTVNYLMASMCHLVFKVNSGNTQDLENLSRFVVDLFKRRSAERSEKLINLLTNLTNYQQCFQCQFALSSFRSTMFPFILSFGLWCAAIPTLLKKSLSPSLTSLSGLPGYYKCQLETQSALSVIIKLY